MTLFWYSSGLAKRSKEEPETDARPSEPPPQEPRAKRKRPLWLRIAKVLVLSVAAVLGLLALVVVFLHSGPGQRLVRDKLVERVAGRLNGSLQLGQLEFVLFGDVALRDVRLLDEAGRQVVSLQSLHVTPAWSRLLGGEIALHEVALDGLQLSLEQDARGVINLKRLFKPQPPSSTKRKDKRIVVNQLRITNVGLTLDKPDGTRFAVDKLGISGSIDAFPSTKTARIALAIGASVVMNKKRDGVDLAIDDIQTGVEVNVDQGSGSLALARTKGSARIRQRGHPDRAIDLDLAGISFEIAEGKLAGTLKKLAVGALALQALEIRGSASEKGLIGDQKVQLVGLHVGADKVNHLLGRKVLASDIDIETRLTGPQERLAVASLIKTAGGKLTVDGLVDMSDPGAPDYAVAVVLSDVSTRKLLLSKDVPAVLVRHLKIGARGTGRSKELAEVDVGLHVAGVTVDKHRVDDVQLAARYDGGEVRLAELSVKAYDHKVLVRGWADIVRKLVDFRVTLAGDVGTTLGRLRKAGLKVPVRLPHRALVLRENVVRARLRGELEGLLRADVLVDGLDLAGGKLHASARADLRRNLTPGPGEKKVELRDLAGTVMLTALDLKRLLALRGKKLPGMTGTISGKVDFGDAPVAPWLDYRLRVRAQPSDKPRLAPNEPTLELGASGRVTKKKLGLDLVLHGTDADRRDELLVAQLRVPLHIVEGRSPIAPRKPLHVELTVPERSIAGLLHYVPERLLLDRKTGKPRTIPNGTFRAHVRLGGTAEQPRGSINLGAEAAAIAGRSQRLQIDGAIKTQRRKVVVDALLEAWLDVANDKLLKGKLRAELSRSPLIKGPESALAWSLDLDVLPQQLAKLPLPKAKLEGLSGMAKAAIKLAGNRRDVTGSVALDVEQLLLKEKGLFDLHVGLALDEKTTNLGVALELGGAPLLTLSGNIARPGKGLLAALRDKTPGRNIVEKLGNPALDLQLAVPKHTPKVYAAIKPKLASWPGSIAGAIDISGDLKRPLASGVLGYRGFNTASGKEGKLAVVLAAEPEKLGARLEVGPVTSGKEPPLVIAADLSRAAQRKNLAAKKCHAAAKPKEPCPVGAMLPISARVSAAKVDLADLVPDSNKGDKKLKIAGKLSWQLAGAIKLDPQPRYSGSGEERVKLSPISPDSKLLGTLALERAAFGLPGTKRRYHDVSVDIRHVPSGLQIDGIKLRESDREKALRKLDITGSLAMKALKPGALELRLRAKDWLLFGGGKVGPADAPRATLDVDLKVVGDVGKPLKTIDVTVDKLALLIPDRYTRAHQPETNSLGDVIFLDGSKQAPGKLPVPKRAAKNPINEYTAAMLQPGPERGLNLRVRIPKKAHVLLPNPMNLYVAGEILVRRRGAGRRIDGEMNVLSGDLALGGRKHLLKEGAIYFAEGECASGCMDLLFARRQHNATLRDISQASGGETVDIHIQGPLAARRTTLSGAGSPGTLYDVLSVHNVGRQRYVGQPDMPATSTAEFPQQDNLLMLSYLAVNVPNLLFLDKVAAWADAYDDRSTQSYGRLQHYEAEGYGAGGDYRVRAVTRPAGAGQSSAELQLDWLWSNTSRSAFGVGVAAGDRLGGGAGLFFEWSSKD